MSSTGSLFASLPASTELLDIRLVSAHALVRQGNGDDIRLITEQPELFSASESGRIREETAIAKKYGNGNNRQMSSSKPGEVDINGERFARPDPRPLVIIELPKGWAGHLEVETAIFGIADVECVGTGGLALTSSLGYISDEERHPIQVGQLLTKGDTRLRATISGGIAGKSIATRGQLEATAGISGKVLVDALSATRLVLSASQAGFIRARERSWARSLVATASQTARVVMVNVDTAELHAEASMSGTVALDGSAGSGSASASMSGSVALSGLFNVRPRQCMSGVVNNSQCPGDAADRFTRAILRALPEQLRDDRLALAMLITFGPALAAGIEANISKEALDSPEMQSLVERSIPAVTVQPALHAALTALSQSITANGGTVDNMQDQATAERILTTSEVPTAYRAALQLFIEQVFVVAQTLI